ncbi:MAG: cysteine hydrolase family protein, partial [Vampirovibrionia bacterium]
MNNSIFLDIDTQIDFMNADGALYVPGAEKIKQNIVSIFKCAANSDIKIISSLDTHFIDDPEFEYFPPHCLTGSYGHQKLDETILNNNIIVSVDHKGSLPITFSQYIFEKNTYNIFSNKFVDVLINQINPDKFYVFGVATDYCFKSAILGLLEREYNVVLIEDAIAG